MMRVVVVGGGIGGLATAVALGRAGFEPVVLEQALALAPVGAGINLAANAMKALTALGADAHVRSTGVKGEQELYLDLATGRPIARRQLLGPVAAERYGDVYHSVHRADLVDALVAQLPVGALRLNSRVVSLEERPRGVAVHLQGGEIVEGDILVGADGLKSRVRSLMFGEDEPKFLGIQGWRTLFPRSSLPAHMPPSEGLSAWLGPGRTASMYPIRSDLMYGGAFVPAEEVREESWTSQGGIDELRAAFRGACDDVQMFIDAVERSATTLFLTSMYYRDPLEKWSIGRVTLLGDAAHPGPPAAGMGAAMALEDAITLAGCLKRGGADPVAALVEYEKRRLPRTRRVVQTALAIQNAVRTTDPMQIAARNGRFRGLARLDPVGETSFGWMAGHDVTAALERTVDEVSRPARQLVNPHVRPEARRAFAFWQTALTVNDRSGGWIGERAGYERAFAALAENTARTDVKRIDADGVSGLLVGRGDGPVVLHLHGGGFTLGSAASSAGLASRLSLGLGGPVFVPDYRLAPEHPFPAALDDAAAAYRWLRRTFDVDRPIVLTGECAGGGLAVSLAARLRDGPDVAPVALCVVSPFADLSLASATLEADRDAWFDRDSLTFAAASYLHDHDPEDPEASPIRADCRGLPPMLVFAAESEVLHGDAFALAQAARTAQVPVEFVSVGDSVHSFVLFDFLPEAREAVGAMKSFVERHMSRPS